MDMNTALLLPMSALVFYTIAFGVFNFFARFKAAKTGELKVRYFKTYSDKSLVSDRLLLYERHFDNQFQAPILFLCTCLAVMVSKNTTELSVALAWVFVISRLAHAFVHLGSNHVLFRATSYFVGALVIGAMWLQILIQSFAAS